LKYSLLVFNYSCSPLKTSPRQRSELQATDEYKVYNNKINKSATFTYEKRLLSNMMISSQTHKLYLKNQRKNIGKTKQANKNSRKAKKYKVQRKIKIKILFTFSVHIVDLYT
jgi:hypothetical protein